MKPDNNPPLRSFRYTAEVVSLLACAVLVAAVLVAAWLSGRNHDTAEREFALRHADDMALVLQTYTRDTLLSIDDAVLRVKRDFERDGLRMDLAGIIRDHRNIANYITQASVADAQGQLILSTPPMAPGTGIADLAHFQAHVERDTGELFINKPGQGRVSGNWTFHLTRRINRHDGSFGGVANVAVDLSHWERLLRDGYFGNASNIALIGRDGAARAVFQRGANGQELLQTDWNFLVRAAEEQAAGGRTATPGPGGTSATWSYRAVGDFPLLVAVSVDEDAVVARSSGIYAWYFGGALVIVVLACLFTAALLFFLSRQRRHESETTHIVQAWRESEERFHSVFDQAAIGMGLRPVGQRDLPWQKVNRKMCDFLGYTEKELLALPRSAINVPEDAGFMADMDRRLIDGDVKSYNREKQFLRKDGTRVWGQVTVTVLHYLDGQPGQVLSIVQDIDDRKRAETAMLESEERYRRLFDANPLPAMIRDQKSLAILAVNQAMIDKYGYSREQLSGMTALQLHSAGTRGDVQLEIGVERKGETYKTRRMHVTRDGVEIEVEITARPFEFNGTAARLVVINDVTAQIASERALREREGHLRAIIAAEPECVAIVAPDGRLIDMNPAGLRMLEAGNLEEMQRRPFLKQVAPKFRRDFVRLQHRILAGGTGMLEFEAVGIAGKRRWLEIHGAPLHDASGAITALLGIARDVTERRQAREALATERNLLRTVIDNLPDRVRVRDRDMRIMLANEAWRKTHAPDHSDVTGMENQDLQIPGKVGRHNEEDLAVLATGQPSSPREDVDGAPENPSWYITTKTPLRGIAGDVIGVVSISRNVTDFKRRSMEVEKLNAALEARVAERTAQLTSANEELEEFASSVSHDLRAPLRHIDGMATALLEDYPDRLDAQGQGYLQRIRSAALRMAGLIEDLLRLSRVMRAELNLTAVDLSEIAGGIAEDLRREQPERIVTFRITPGMRVKGDAGLLRSALVNLLHNAWKFSGRKDNALIEFGTEQRDGVTTYFVRDNGAGFDMAQIDRLFDAFQRLHSEREFPGTGVGLATVRRIVRRHGGEAWAEAEVGKGATFFFTLGSRPAARVTVATAVPAARLAVAGGAPAAYAGRSAILLVDDEPEVLILSMRALRTDGYEVLTAATGEAALAILRTRAVNVIVSDFSMPGMHGAQFLAQAAVLHPETLRIIVSGQTMNRAMQAGLRKGEIHHYFEKQHDYNAVRTCISDWLAGNAGK